MAGLLQLALNVSTPVPASNTTYLGGFALPRPNRSGSTRRTATLANGESVMVDWVSGDVFEYQDMVNGYAPGKDRADEPPTVATPQKSLQLNSQQATNTPTPLQLELRTHVARRTRPTRLFASAILYAFERRPEVARPPGRRD